MHAFTCIALIAFGNKAYCYISIKDVKMGS